MSPLLKTWDTSQTPLDWKVTSCFRFGLSTELCLFGLLRPRRFQTSLLIQGILPSLQTELDFTAWVSLTKIHSTIPRFSSVLKHLSSPGEIILLQLLLPTGKRNISSVLQPLSSPKALSYERQALILMTSKIPFSSRTMVPVMLADC